MIGYVYYESIDGSEDNHFDMSLIVFMILAALVATVALISMNFALKYGKGGLCLSISQT